MASTIQSNSPARSPTPEKSSPALTQAPSAAPDQAGGTPAKRQEPTARSVDGFESQQARAPLALISGGGQQVDTRALPSYRVGFNGALRVAAPAEGASRVEGMNATSGAGAGTDAALTTDINDVYTQQLGRPCEDADGILAQARAAGAQSSGEVHAYVTKMVTGSPEKAALEDVNAQFQEKLGRSLTVPEQATWLAESGLNPSDSGFHGQVASKLTSSPEYTASHPVQSSPGTYYQAPPKALEQNLPGWALPAPAPTGVAQVDVALSHYGERAGDAVNGRGLDPTFNETYTKDVDNCCANFVSACCEKAGVIKPGSGSASVEQMRRSMLNQGFQQVAAVPASQGLNQGNCQVGDVVCLHDPNDSPPYVHTELVAGFDASGKAICVGSNNVAPDGSQVVAKDDYTWAAKSHPAGQFEILRAPAP